MNQRPSVSLRFSQIFDENPFAIDLSKPDFEVSPRHHFLFVESSHAVDYIFTREERTQEACSSYGRVEHFHSSHDL